MSEFAGYQDIGRDPDGEIRGTKVYEDGSTGERVRVRVSVEREHRNAAGELVAQGEVASSDIPEGQVGSVSFG